MTACINTHTEVQKFPFFHEETDLVIRFQDHYDDQPVDLQLP